MTTEYLLDLAIEAAVKAGAEILKVYNNQEINIQIKSDDTPITQADRNAHTSIVNDLHKSGIPILSEEGEAITYEERKNWDKLWIVDPLDGTKEFIKRNGEFTVNIALVYNQVPILGVIYVPVTQELYYAEENLGSFKAEYVHKNTDVRSLKNNATKLNARSESQKFKVVASKSHLSDKTVDFIENLKANYTSVETISKGSSLKFCLVAEGIADCYPRFAPTMEWDTAAGQAICMYSGRSVIDWETKKPMLYNRKELLNNWFLVE